MKKLTFFFSLRKLMLVLGIILCEGAQGAESKTINSETWSFDGFTVGNIYNITYEGTTFSANSWELFGLPFDASKEVLDQAFGAGNYQLSQYKEISGSTIIFAPMDTPALKAGKPYMIKVASEVTSPVFNNVTLKLTTEQTTGDSQMKIVIPFLGKAVWNFNGKYAYYVVNGSTTRAGYGSGQISESLEAGKGYIETDGTVNPQVNANNGIREQLTNVPTIYIDIPDVSNLDTDLTKDRSTGEALWHRASIQVVANNDPTSPNYLESFTDDHLQIKVRGNATSDPSKRAYRLKFDKKDETTGQSYKHDLLGKGYSKRNWILKANAFDNSMTRDAVMTELGEYVGMDFVPGYKHVDLVINGDYRGTYLVSDHAEVGSNRIPVDEATGWYVEFQGRNDMLDQPMCFDSPLQMNVKNPEPVDDTDEAQRNAIIQPIKNWFSGTWIPGWDDATYTDPETGWRAYNDEDNWLKFVLVTELTGDYDGYMTVKAYREANGKLCLGPIWDKDLAYGNITCGDDKKMVANFENGSFRTYVSKLYNDKEFINRLRATFQKMLDDGLLQHINNKIDAISENIQQTWSMNYKRWGVTPPSGSMQVFYAWDNQQAYANQLKEWIAARASFLKEQYATMSENAGWMDIDLNNDEPVVTHEQLTDVPTIFITSNGMNADTWDAAATIEVFDANNMIGGDRTFSSGTVGVKYKGDGTAAKPSYRLKFSAKTALLGAKSGSYKQWVLEANDDDPTMLRNGLTEELADQLGFGFSLGCQFADVYVNNHYMGTYQITDRVKVENGRVLAQDKDTDWLVEIASQGEVDTANDLYSEGNTTEGLPYIIIKNPDKDDLTEEEQSTLKSQVGDYFTNTFWPNIAENADQTSLVNWYIAAEIMAAYKQLSDIFAYRDCNDGKLFFGPLDGGEKAYDNTTNHHMDMSDLDQKGSYNGMIFTAADYKVMANKLNALWQEQWFKDAVIAKWKTLYGAEKTVDLQGALTEKLDALAAEIAQTKEYNYKATSEGGAGWTLSGNYTDHVNAIKTYLDNRLAYLNQKFYELAGAEDDVLLGDADGNGVVDIMDVTLLVDHILGKNADKFNEKNADVTANGTIDIADVTAIVNIILGK